MNLHEAVQRIVFDNPTFLLADDLRLDVRSNIEYSKLDRESVKWIETFLIPKLQTFKGLCADIVAHCENNPSLYAALDRRDRINQEIADIETASASLQSDSDALMRRRDVIRSLLQNVNLAADMRRSLKTQLSTIKSNLRLTDGSGARALSASKVLCRRVVGDMEAESKFDMLDKTTMRSIESFRIVDERVADERRILKDLYATRPPPVAEHARIMRCVITDQLLVLFKRLYIKLREHRFNRRALICHATLERKLAIYMHIEEQEKLEAAKQVNAAKDLATKRRMTECANGPTAPVDADVPVAPIVSPPIRVHPRCVRDITKSSVRASDIRDALSLLQRKVDGLERRIKILSTDHVADAYKRLSHADEDASQRAKNHIKLYEQIIVAFQSERCVHEIEREDLERELAEMLADVT